MFSDVDIKIRVLKTQMEAVDFMIIPLNDSWRRVENRKIHTGLSYGTHGHCGSLIVFNPHPQPCELVPTSRTSALAALKSMEYKPLRILC